MADEIVYSDRLKVTKAGVEAINESQADTTLDMSGTDTSSGSQVLSTSEEALRLGDVTAGGVLRITNHDGTDTAFLRPGSGLANCVEIGPGETWTFRVATGSTPYLIASANTPRVSFILLDA